MEEQEIKKAVRDSYALVAEQACSCCSSTCCGTSEPKEISKKIGYTEEELQAVPTGSNLGLGCGNPIALASIKEGETVLDLGSGGGFDCFLASRKVGPNGKIIGVDMTEQMVKRAKANAVEGGYKNVEFRHGEIEKLPVEDNTIDVIVSNCVINLVPDKELAFREAFRVLKPGGRLMVSDIVLLKELPEFLRESIDAYVGCVSGALEKDIYLDAIRLAGFQDVNVVDETVFPLDYMINDPTSQLILEGLKISADQLKEIEDSISSIKVNGFKPR
ncbi:MAG: arsenite methyltransferase [Methanotrichaceae archaeon]|nr:arsenite methyltransferase [Methanotrichaceae archaeon]